MNFKKGDKVKIIGYTDISYKDSVGVTGEIEKEYKHINDAEYFIIKLDRRGFVWASNGSGLTAEIIPGGYFFAEKYQADKILAHYIPPVPYVAGKPISDHVSELIAAESDAVRKKWLNVFQNCALPPDVKEVIEEALAVILCGDKFQSWGINDHFEKGLTNSILIYGPPGTGKTMISESFAAVLGKNLMKIDSEALQSNVPGQTERNIKKAFAAAVEKDCVLLFDECDSVLSNREGAGIILGAEINCLLTEIENFSGVCILTTNRVHRLDPALARRIVAKIELGLPDQATRATIWENLMPKPMPLGECVKFNVLSAYELSGGEIKNAILLAARKAIAKNHDVVTMEHFLNAVALVEKGNHEFKPKKDIARVAPSQNGSGGNFIFDMLKDKEQSKNANTQA